ncbi:unnamed protein product [Lactuca saligna]|uniref:DOMON domain-containing protein n=1 Tax=Lactuca saligna TaxID=75948 RepID=A0AA36ENK3_LACSI|nr:unnamed protein product [Lactuca saligna]
MAITISSALLIYFHFLVSHFDISYAQMCSEYKFTSRRIYSSCRDLPHLSAQLHWTYNSSTGIAQIAYQARQGPRGWVAWAVNPNQIGMVGSEALVAFHNSNGSMTVYTTLINNYSPSMVPGNLSFQVSGGSVVNHVWQSGYLVLNDVPQMHAISQQNLQSTGEIDFLFNKVFGKTSILDKNWGAAQHEMAKSSMDFDGALGPSTMISSSTSELDPAWIVPVMGSDW